MAQMIPAECDLSKRPISEQIVFEYIKNGLSDQWKVFHSFDYIGRDQNRAMWDGEIDFLLYHPDHGFLVIEVKGGVISCRDGQWYQDGRPINPVHQAKRNKYAVLQLLERRLGKRIPLKFAHAVCFPSCRKQYVWPAEAEGIVLTEDTLPYIESFATQLLNETPLPVSIRDTISEPEVMLVLAPVFEYGSKLMERMGVEERIFFSLTEQQCMILDHLSLFHRLMICGCAGSGKTVMAVKKAIALAAQNKRVLLLCFNQLLAKILQRSVKDHPQIRAAAFFDYCIDLLKIPEEQISKYRSDPRLYSDVLPLMLRKYIERTCLYYDAVIVDEGQDFTREAWNVISLLPEENGHFYIFYDPDQNIYTQELQLPDFGIPPFLLNRNCRNTRNIFNALTPYHSMKCTVLENTPEGSGVRVLHGDCRELLEAELLRLRDRENIPLQDIVVLGAHSLEHTVIGSDPQIGPFCLVSADPRPDRMDVQYYTYMKYKGCEAKVVILLDVDQTDPRWSDRHGIYTAMSRAIHELIILHRD